MLLPVFILFSWLRQGHLTFSGPFTPYGVLVFFVRTSEYSFPLGHCPFPQTHVITSKMTATVTRSSGHGTHALVKLHADTRMTQPICLSPPTPPPPKHRVKWSFQKGPTSLAFLFKKIILLRPPNLPQTQAARRVMSLAERWLLRSSHHAGL